MLVTIKVQTFAEVTLSIDESEDLMEHMQEMRSTTEPDWVSVEALDENGNRIEILED